MSTSGIWDLIAMEKHENCVQFILLRFISYFKWAVWDFVPKYCHVSLSSRSFILMLFKLTKQQEREEKEKTTFPKKFTQCSLKRLTVKWIHEPVPAQILYACSLSEQNSKKGKRKEKTTSGKGILTVKFEEIYNEVNTNTWTYSSSNSISMLFKLVEEQETGKKGKQPDS